MNYPRIASLKSEDQFRRRMEELEIELPLGSLGTQDRAVPLAQTFEFQQQIIGNRFAILPMEGWDGLADGRPSDFTRRRWRHFGESGAKLIWGGEAIAVTRESRANPNQLVMDAEFLDDLRELRSQLVEAHRQAHGNVDDLYVGLQLTHSGRYSKPNADRRPLPQTAYQHPILDSRMKIGAEQVLSDDDLDRLVDRFVDAALLAEQAGFKFVDIKHCHGYLGHELLSAVQRPGKYGGRLENRTRFLRQVVEGIRSAAPQLAIGVRLSVYDYAPFQVGSSGKAEPMTDRDYPFAFGGDGTGRGIDLREPIELLDMLQSWGVRLICTTAGCPYYCAHVQRPALFPPSDGYDPPEDPLVGVARQIAVTSELKQRFPDLIFVGSGYSYLQEWLPRVAAGVISNQQADFVGLGRMVLSYPTLPADVLAGRGLQRKRICRTFSDCTTAPRNGMRSGCYPLDPFYKALPERQQLVELKKAK